MFIFQTDRNYTVIDINRGANILQFMDPQKKIIPQYISAKAGMGSVNAESIAKVVAELTSGTPKDLHEKQLQKKRSLQVTAMIEKILKYNQEDREAIKSRWNQKIDELNLSRPLHKYWAHFDFDMFYVACELLDKPEYKDVPCGVGGENSVLCTANYAARLFGVRAAMPTFIAKKLCPEIILFKPDFQKYRKYSQIFRETLRRFDPNLQSHGLDQAYIDLTEHIKGKSLSQQEQFIQNIRKEIFDKTQLTVSCGVGANQMLAKMASEIQKPNGQFIIPNDGELIQEFMADKRIRKIPGIGPVNEYFLKGLKIETAKDLLENTDVLAICFSENSCQFFISAALGLGSIEHEIKQRKSVGKSETFRPNSQKSFLQSKLLQLCEEVSLELEELGFMSTNVVLSYQLENYDRKDKTFNLDKCSKDKQSLYNGCIHHLKDSILTPGKKIRLLGVKCTNLMKIEDWKRKTLQSFFSKAKQKNKDIEKEKEKEKKETAQKQQKQTPGSDKKAKTQAQDKKTVVKEQQSFITDIKQKSQFICPICNKQVPCMNNISAFNRHIDKCLKTAK